MPILSRDQIKGIAKGIANMMVVDVLIEFPEIDKAVRRTKRETWSEAVDALEASVEEVLLNRFGCSD